jgi:protein-S-isoprenylcysteine O-methyltransferase Ste14
MNRRRLRAALAMVRSAELSLAWAGGAAFAASLLYFLYFFFRSIDARPVQPWGVALAADLALFTAFALHHSVMARTGAKALLARHLRAPLERTVFVWLSSLLFFAVCWWWQAPPGTLYRADGALRWLLYGGQAAGVAIAVRASGALSMFDLAGISQVRRATSHPPTLQDRGLYRLVRHPVYLGWVLMVFATPDMTAARLLFAVISTGYLALAVPLEERSLIETFGAAYLEYRQRVRWRMVPGLY